MTTGLVPSGAPGGGPRGIGAAVEQGGALGDAGETHRRGRLAAVVHLAPVAAAAQALEELAEREVERCGRVLGAGLGADHGSLAADRDLDLLAVLGLARVP